MEKILKLVTLIIQLLSGLLPMLELFGRDGKDVEKTNQALALLKEVKINQKENV